MESKTATRPERDQMETRLGRPLSQRGVPLAGGRYPPEAGPVAGLRVRRIETEDDLAAIRQPWTAMLAEAEHVSVFLTWEWICAWWRHRQQDWPLWLLTAWDEDKALAAVAPLMLVSEGQGPFAVRRLVFLGDRFTPRYHQDFIARERDRASAAQAFLAYLRGHRGAWDVLDLEGLIESSALRPHLSAGLGRYLERAPARCPYITLPATWEAYAGLRLSANRRQQLRQWQRSLERDYAGQVEFRLVSAAEELPAALDSLAALAREGCHARDLASSFDGDCFVAFNREFAALALANGWLRFYLLNVAGQAIAAEYGFLYRGVLSHYQKGCDPAWERYSPGQIMQAFIIRQAIEDGAREFDLLQCAHRYEPAWTDQERLDRHLVASASWQGQAWLLRERLADAVRGLGRQIMPPAATPDSALRTGDS